MEIPLLKTFLEVNRTRHFGRAAENLCLTQSAVSARIRLLEEQLGVPLFERRRNDIRLTVSGRCFLPHAEKVVSAWQVARSELAELAQPEHCSVGVVPPLWDPVLRPWLETRLQDDSELVIHSNVSGLHELCRELLDGELDFLLCLDAPRSAEFRVTELRPLRLEMVCNRQVGDLQTALGTGYVLVNWGTDLVGELSETVAARPVLSVGMAAAALAHILDRGGAAYLPATMVAPHLESGRLSMVPEAPIVERPVLGVFGRGPAAADRVKPWFAEFA